jgi:metal-responsive CopG/Arc/MetJ family transcriptional regulator
MKLRRPPKRQSLDLKYQDKDGVKRELITFRLPKSLLGELDKVAKREGYRRTELIQYALDQLCQAMKD